MDEEALKDSIRQTGKFTPIEEGVDPYVGEFENLLYEEEQGEELALNDSFEEMERSEHSEKNMQILKQVNQRREKELEEKRAMEGMKERIACLIGEERDLISRNIELRLQIKRMQQARQETSGAQKGEEIAEMKRKIAGVKAREQELLRELGRDEEQQEGEGAGEEAQLSRDKATQSSINLLKPYKNPLTISIRSNPNAQSEQLVQHSTPCSPNPGISQSMASSKGTKPSASLMHSIQGGFPTNAQGFLSPQPEPVRSGQARQP